MPSTTGNRSRARPRRRATISAREGSPRRAGSVADISTPIVVPWTASAIRGRASGSAAFKIACQETARSSIEAHISASPNSTHGGLERTSASPIRDRPDVLDRQHGADDGRRGPRRPTSAARGQRPAGAPAPAPATAGAARARAAARPRAARRSAPPARRIAPSGAGTATRVLVGRRRPARPPAATRSARRSTAAPRASRVDARGIERQVAQRLGQRRRVPARHEHPVHPGGDDVAVARDVRRDDRRPGRERLRQDHPERLAAERRRAQHVGVAQRGRLDGVVDAPERGHALALDQQRRQLLRRQPDDRQLGRNLAAQRLEGAQQHRQALALDGLADEHDPQRLARAPARAARARRRRAARRRSG